MGRDKKKNQTSPTMDAGLKSLTIGPDQELTPEERRTRIGGGGHQELIGTETSVKPPRPTPKGLGKQVGFANQNQVLDDKMEKTPGTLQEGLKTKIAPGDALEL